MNKLIAKLDLKDYCNNRTTLKIHLLEDGQLSYGLASTKTGMGHAMSNLQIGFKNDSRLPDHIQDIEGFLEDHILNCIEDSVKTYLPDSYVTYHELEQEKPHNLEQEDDRVNVVINILKDIGVDGETMQYIIEEVGMNDQMLRQLVLSNPQSDTKALYDEHIRLSDQELNRLKK
jgi:hypothetical protein